MANITKETEVYIKSHPYVMQAMKNGIVNYSKLSRIIAREKKIKGIDAILIACRRYQDKIKKVDSSEVINLLKGSKLSIKNKIVVIVLESSVPFQNLIFLQKEVEEKKDLIRIIRSEGAITLICTEEYVDSIKKKFSNNIISIKKEFIEITLKSSSKLENVPGVMGYLYSLFAENEINILETLSCWTDTIFIIHKDDLSKAIEVLNF